MRAPLFVLLLTACGSASDGAPPRQMTQLWPEGHRLYVADTRQGVVRAFSTYDSPRAAGEGRAPGRGGVIDMKLDPARGRLWVLGREAVYLHDAVTLTLLHRYPLAGFAAADSRLMLDDSGEAKLVADPAVDDKRAGRL